MITWLTCRYDHLINNESIRNSSSNKLDNTLQRPIGAIERCGICLFASSGGEKKVGWNILQRVRDQRGTFFARSKTGSVGN